MQPVIDHLKRDLSAAATVPDMVDAAHKVTCRTGFDGLIYDFAPIATTPQGVLATPTHLSHRNVPGDMRDLWCAGGYHQHDPVQQMALMRGAPFCWSYRRGGARTALAQHLTDEHAPVSAYLHDAGLTCGITVPLHRTQDGFATFTVIQKNATPRFAEDAGEMLQQIGLIGQILHEAALLGFTPHEMQGVGLHLTARERECLALSAEGYTAREIAGRIRRSVPTATLHLKSAMNKLGARNRAHAIALAIHYKLLDL